MCCDFLSPDTISSHSLDLDPGHIFHSMPRWAALHPILAQHTCHHQNLTLAASRCPQTPICTMPHAPRIGATIARIDWKFCFSAPFQPYFTDKNISTKPGPAPVPPLNCHALDLFVLCFWYWIAARWISQFPMSQGSRCRFAVLMCLKPRTLTRIILGQSNVASVMCRFFFY